MIKENAVLNEMSIMEYLKFVAQCDKESRELGIRIQKIKKDS